MAENTNRLEDVELPHLMVTIDAMDKSKWLVPRSLDSSKRLAALWRPALHVVGVLIAGVLEYFAIVEPDVKADSDLQQTLLARALDLAEDELRKRGKGMPWKVIFHSDNTSKEGRNSQLLLFATALVSSQRFAEVSLAMFRVGHTHTQQAGSEIQCDWVFACAGEMLANTRRVCQPFARALSLSSWCPSADRASWRQLPLAQFFCTFGSTLCRRDRYSEHS